MASKQVLAGVRAGTLLRALLPCLALAGMPSTLCAAAPSVAPSPETMVAPVAVDPDAQAFAHGAFLSMKGSYRAAIGVFRKLSPKDSSDAAAVHYAMSKAFLHLAAPDSARVHGESAVRLDPTNLEYVRTLARLVQEMRDYHRAATLFGQAAALAPDRVELLHAQGLAYTAARRPVQALAAYEAVLKRDQNDQKALSQVLWLQIALKRYAEAIASVGRLEAVAGSSQKLRLTLGELYELDGQGGRAAETFRSIIAEDRNAVPAWVNLLDHDIRAGDQPGLIRDFLAFDGLSPADAASSLELVRLFAARTDREPLYLAPVDAMLLELVRRHPRDPRVYRLKGAFEMTLRRYDQAVTSFSTALRLAPKQVDAWENLVMVRLEQGQRHMAFAMISQARRALPRERWRLDVLEGYALLQTGSPAKAVRKLEPVAGLRHAGRKLNQDLLIRANTTLAIAGDQLGKRRLSETAYRNVLVLDPHNALAMNNLAYLYAEEGAMLHRALHLATGAVQLEPANGVFLDTLGWVNYRLGNYAAACDVLEKAVATGIDEAEVFSHLAAVYLKLGKTEQAKAMRERAVKAKGR